MIAGTRKERNAEQTSFWFAFSLFRVTAILLEFTH